MKAAVLSHFGPPENVNIVDVEKPTPNENEILVKVYATSVTAADWRLRTKSLPKGFGLFGGLFFGFSKPRQPILGMECSGVVEAAGEKVNKFKIGDEVIVSTEKMGCHAEYRAVNQELAIALKPKSISFEEGATLSFGGLTANHFLLKGGVAPGSRVLINGASGGVGTAAVTLAKFYGAHVTAVCSSANHDLVASLGADVAIDYAGEDFTKGGEVYDIIMDCVGNAPFSRSKRALKKGGSFLLVIGSLGQMLAAPLASLFSRKKIIGWAAMAKSDDLKALCRLAEEGAFRPYIDKTFPLSEIREAYKIVDSGRKRGCIAITMER